MASQPLQCHSSVTGVGSGMGEAREQGTGSSAAWVTAGTQCCSRRNRGGSVSQVWSRRAPAQGQLRAPRGEGPGGVHRRQLEYLPGGDERGSGAQTLRGPEGSRPQQPLLHREGPMFRNHRALHARPWLAPRPVQEEETLQRTVSALESSASSQGQASTGRGSP